MAWRDTVTARFAGSMVDLREFAAGAATDRVGVYAARVKPAGGQGFHFEVELDGLQDERGAVSLEDCQAFSQRFVELVDNRLARGGGPDTEGLPEGLTPDNYSLEVASAGAERELRLPEDLERFRGLPLKLRYRDSEGKDRSDLVVFQGIENDAGEASFEPYTPKRKRRSKGEKKQNGREIRLPLCEMIRANLYLDF